MAWWSREGEKVLEFESCMQDYIVRMDWSVSGEGLWMCGFSCLCYLAVERNEAGKVGMGVVSGCGQCLGKGHIVFVLLQKSNCS